jgi:hypothetical protein
MTTKQNDIVEVNLSLETPSFSTEDSFSVPLIIATLNNTDERVQTFSDVDGVEDAGYDDTTDIHKFAASYFGQTGKEGGRPNLLKLGKKSPDANCTQVVTFDADASAGTYTIKVGDLDATAAIAYDGNVAAIKSALESVSGISEVTVSLNTDATVPTHKEGFTIEFTGADAKTDFGTLVVGIGSLTSVATVTVTKLATGIVAETWLEAYTAIKLSTQAFFMVKPAIKESGVSGTITELVALSAQVETEPRLVVYTVSDANTYGADAGSASLAKKLYTLGYDNSIVITSKDDTSNAGACEFGACLPDFLAGVNPCYYPLTGVVADDWTSTEIGYIVAKNCNRIEKVDGVNTVMPAVDLIAANGGIYGGITSGGQFIDLMAAKYYLEEKIAQGVYALLISVTKIPMSPSGFEIIKGKITEVLVEHGVEKNIIEADSIVIDMPDFATYSSTKKAQRWLDGVDGNGTLSGAINKITIGFKLVA